MELFTEYFKKDHIIARVDARIKLFVAISILIMVLSYEGFVFPLFIMFLCGFLCIKMNVPLKVFIMRFSEPIFIASVIVLLKFLFSGKEIMWIGYKDGLTEGLLIACRIMGAVSIIAILGFSTPFTELIAGLSWFKVPKGFIEILMLTYRYIFVLLEDAIVIYNAQKNRLGYSTMKRGLSSFGTLAGSLMIKAFEHSQNTTLAMVQRGYDGDIPMLRHRPFKPIEVAGSTLFILITGILWKM